MNRAFERSLNSLKESNGEYFLVDVGRNNQTLRIVVDPSATEWIRIYKYRMWQLLAQKMGKNADHAFLEKYAVLHYFYLFVIPDILVIRKLLPERMSAALNIGAGIGLIDVFLYQYYAGHVLLTLTELERMSEIDHVDEPSVSLDVPLNTLELLRSVVKSNDLKNCDVVDSGLIGNHSGKRFDYVFSFRSWGYLYDLDGYFPFVAETLEKDGVVIADLSNKFDSEAKFNRYFTKCRMVQEFGNGKRWMGYKK